MPDRAWRSALRVLASWGPKKGGLQARVVEEGRPGGPPGHSKGAARPPRISRVAFPMA